MSQVFPLMPSTPSTIAFFSSAASSFQPAPYAATTQSSSSRSTSHLTRTHQRSHDSLAIPPPGMDPLPTDPKVHFIHSPFDTFPNSHLHPDGLTYQLMADNPEWFLDAKDFLPSLDGGKGPLVYPPHLEPPRGWCPAKKKDLKDRGAEGWPEGEEPRLRCTFCRRTYAGVNAKSMWRRHVFEKHRIAMSNRRDGNMDRPRGRGSGSKSPRLLLFSRSDLAPAEENRPQSAPKPKDATHDSLLSIVVAPQTITDTVSHKSRFRPAKPQPQEASKPLPEHDAPRATLVPNDEPVHQEHSSDEDSECGDLAQSNSPPLTPHGSDPTYSLVGESSISLEVRSSANGPSIPESPYNPLQTPSFRHSPPRLPSPWRFPSPSHPLHSTTRDLSLTIVAQPDPSPSIKDIRTVESSPSMLLSLASSPFSKDRIIPSSDAFETPARSKLIFAKSINKPYLMIGQSSSPVHAVKAYRNRSHTFGGSPLRKTIPSASSQQHKRHSSTTSEAWFSEGNLTSLSSTPLRLPHISTDPFSIYDSWPSMVEDGRVSPVRFPKVYPEPDSPVLRNGNQAVSVGLGIGLLEPFSSPPKALEDTMRLFSPQPGWRTSTRKRRVPFDDTPEESVAEASSPLRKRRRSPTDS